MRLLIIDNYDSFTYNLFQLASEVFESIPMVLPNDHDFNDIVARDFDAVLISPGPGSPVNDGDFGVCKRVIQELDIPILGVCLGHQGIGHLMGGRVTHAPAPMHGREDHVYHSSHRMFEGVPNPFVVVRYHSLIVDEPLPECLEATAWTEDGLIMAMAHRTRPVWSVQFHPESICSTFGLEVMRNFHRLAADFHRARGTRQVGEPAPGKAREEQAKANRAAGTGSKLRMHVRRCELPLSAEEIFERAFNHLPYAFWLDSSLTREHDGRFSFLGGETADEVQCIRYFAHSRRLSIRRKGIEELGKEDLFAHLSRVLSSTEIVNADLPFDFNGGFVGYFGYELKALAGARAVHKAQHPDCLAMLTTRFVAIDHSMKEMFLVYIGEGSDSEKAQQWFEQISTRIARDNNPAPGFHEDSCSGAITFNCAYSEAEYLEKIDRALDAIKDGETYEVCLTNQLTASTGVEPFAYYKRLRVRNPAPYSAFLRFPEICVASSSPERFLKIGSDRVVETKPIKGTAPRGRSKEEDDQLKSILANDTKSRSENLMIVDLLRNDLGRVCEVGSVYVPKLMHVETYSTVHQLVTTIRGTLAVDRSPVDCLKAAFPGGSMTGAPKIRTMEIIDELERRARGVYSGSIGFLSFGGKADLSIVIRTAVFSKNTVTIGVGGAVIALSDPHEEWREILLKARALLATFEEMGNTVVISSRNQDSYGTTIDLSKRVG